MIEIWEPTFRTKPKENERFVPKEVEKIIKDVMEKKLKKVKYEDPKCKKLALELCAEIKEKVKGAHLDPGCTSHHILYSQSSPYRDTKSCCRVFWEKLRSVFQRS